MPSDSLEIAVGEPRLIVDGVPFLHRVPRGPETMLVVDKKDYDRYETWFLGPSRVDTIHSQVPVTLYSTEFDTEQQSVDDAHLEYSYAVVIDKLNHRVALFGYYPRGFLDSENDVQLGAIVDRPG